MLELKQVLSAFLGAALAIAGQWVLRKISKAWSAKRLALAFSEEMSAASFYDTSDGRSDFAGFSSQTFTSLYRELAESLPESLVRDVMRYHWRMKYLAEVRSAGWPEKFYQEAKSLNGDLKDRFARFTRRRVPSLVLYPWEKR